MEVKGARRRLENEFQGLFSPESIDQCLRGSLDQLANAKVQSHVLVLAERFTRERLRAAAQAEGSIVKEVPEVLFVCVHNAGRSQMAASLLHAYAEGRIHVRSAGSAPADEINPAVVAAMDEIGIDMSAAFPKPLTNDVVEAADVVITMGCGDACPIYPGKRYLDWELEDPNGKSVEQVRAIRDDISKRVKTLADELVRAEV